MAEVAPAIVEPQSPANATKDKGYRYTQGQRESAFHLWATLVPPSLERTAGHLGIPERTLRRWYRDDDWPARLDAMRCPDVLERGSAAQRIDTLTDQLIRQSDVLAIVAVIETLREPKARDRIRAAELALGLNGRVVPKVGITQRVPYGEGQAISAHELAQLDPDALLALASARLSPPAGDVTDATPEPQPE